MHFHKESLRDSGGLSVNRQQCINYFDNLDKALSYSVALCLVGAARPKIYGVDNNRLGVEFGG